MPRGIRTNISLLLIADKRIGNSQRRMINCKFCKFTCMCIFPFEFIFSFNLLHAHAIHQHPLAFRSVHFPCRSAHQLQHQHRLQAAPTHWIRIRLCWNKWMNTRIREATKKRMLYASLFTYYWSLNMIGCCHCGSFSRSPQLKSQPYEMQAFASDVRRGCMDMSEVYAEGNGTGA